MKTHECSSWHAGVTLAVALVVVYPALPILAAETESRDRRPAEWFVLLANDPLVTGVRALGQTVNMPGSWVAGAAMQVDNLVHQPGELIELSDGRLRLEIDVSAYDGGNLVPIGQALVFLSGNGIETFSHFDVSGEHLRIDASITTTASGDLEFAASLNGGEEFVVYEAVNGELSLIAGDEEAFREAQLPLELVGTTPLPITGIRPVSLSPDDPAFFWAGVIVIIVLVVFLYIAVCSYGALTGRFTCCVDATIQRSEDFLKGGRALWMILKRNRLMQATQPITT